MSDMIIIIVLFISCNNVILFFHFNFVKKNSKMLLTAFITVLFHAWRFNYVTFVILIFVLKIFIILIFNINFVTSSQTDNNRTFYKLYVSTADASRRACNVIKYYEKSAHYSYYLFNVLFTVHCCFISGE